MSEWSWTEYRSTRQVVCPGSADNDLNSGNFTDDASRIWALRNPIRLGSLDFTIAAFGDPLYVSSVAPRATSCAYCGLKGAEARCGGCGAPR